MDHERHISIGSLAPGAIGPAAEVLARAFAEAPRFAYLLPSRDTRPQRLRRYWSVALALALRTGRVDVAFRDGAVGGVAVWEPPGAHATWVDHLLAGSWRTPLVLGLAGFRRRRALGPVIAEMHPGYPCWYLGAIGVAPDWQRRGIGHLLLAHALRRADAEARPCFLDTSVLANVAYYSRFGFTVTAEGQLPDGPPVWGMTRGPVEQVDEEVLDG